MLFTLNQLRKSVDTKNVSEIAARNNLALNWNLVITLQQVIWTRWNVLFN